MTLIFLLWTSLAAAGPPNTGERAVEHARHYTGTEYVWAGRGTASNPGIDCLGLLFRSWGAVHGLRWQAYPYDPSPLVKSGKLGAPVKGLDGVLRFGQRLELLEAGDVIYLLKADYEIPDDPLWTHAGTKYWPWHTVLYVGGPQHTVIHADPARGVVHEQGLDTLAYDALFVTRPK